MRPASIVSAASWTHTLIFLVSLSVLVGRSEGAPVYTGDGAKAWVQTPKQWAYNILPNTASESGSVRIDYTRSVWGVLTPASVNETYSVDASVTPGALGTPLVQLRGSISPPNPGQWVGAPSSDSEVAMWAGWDGVIAHVASPTGATLPDSINLNFSLTYTPPSNIQVNPAIGWEPTESLALNGYVATYLPEAGSHLLSNDNLVTLGSDGLLHVNFSLALPLSNTGDSQGFGVGLFTKMDGMFSNLAVNETVISTITLNSITLPDGTNLEDDGYTIAFDSGNPMPRLAPEPTTWLAWSLLAAGAAYRFRRLRNG